jgi:lipopolysaccharide transport system permease protein
MVGLCLWNYLTTVTTQGCHCLFQSEKYIRQCPAPMAIYPLRVMLGASFHFAMALSVAIVLRWLFIGFDNLPALIHLVPVLILLLVLGWSIAILTGFANTYFPDTQNLSEVGLQILFYATPVIVPAEVFINKGLGWIVDYNPVAAMLQVLREPILHGTSPSLPVYATAVTSVSILAGAAALTLYKLQRKIIFQL